MLDPAQRQHLGPVFRGHHMPDRLSVNAHHGALVADVAVGVDLHLDPAIRKNALGHDRDHIHALDLLADDEGRGFVIWIGGPRPHGGDEIAPALNDVAVPILRVVALIQKSDGLGPRLDHGQRIKAYQFARVVGIAVAGAGFAVGDEAHHRAGIAADFHGLGVAQVVRHVRPPSGRRAGASAWPVSASRAHRWHGR